MSKLDEEIGFQKAQGFVLAGRFQGCRVYRGNGQIKVFGTPEGERARKGVERLHNQIEALGGHKDAIKQKRRRPLQRAQ